MVGFGIHGAERRVGVEGGDFHDAGGFDVSQLVCLCLRREQQHTQRQCNFCGFIAHVFSPESLFCFVDITLPQIPRRRQRRKNSYL